MTSVNTNVAAITALRTLQQTNNQLDSTQGRISTGLKIGEAKDNAAYWAISTTLKSDNKSLGTVKDALGLGSATVDVAYQGLNKAKDVLDEIKSKLTAASQAGVDKNVIQAEIGELQKQLVSIAGSSVFSGENWLSVDSSTVDYDATKRIVASFARDSNNSVTIGTVDVSIGNVALFDSSTVVGKNGILDGLQSLKDKTGRDMMIGGTLATAGNTGTGGIAAANVTGALDAGAAGVTTNATGAPATATGISSATTTDHALLSTGNWSTNFADYANKKLTLSFQLNGAATQSVTFNAGAAYTDAVANLNTALTAAGAGLTAAVNNSTAVVNLYTTGGSTNQSIRVMDLVTYNASGIASQPTTTLMATGANSMKSNSFAGAYSTSTDYATAGTNALGLTASTSGVYKTNATTLVGAAGWTSRYAATDQVTLNLTIDSKAVSVTVAAGSTYAAFIGNLNNNATFSSVAKAADDGTTPGQLNIVSGTTTTNSTVALNSVTFADKNNVVKAVASSGFEKIGLAASTTSNTFAQVALDNDDSIVFDINVNGASAAKTVTINKDFIGKTLGTTDGRINNIADYKTVVDAAMIKAGVTGVATSLNGTSTALVFTTTTASGTGASVAIANAAGSNGGAQISVDKIDISDAGLSKLNVSSGDDISKVLSAYIAVVNNAINSVTTAASNLGAVASRIDMQKSFVNTLMDTIDKGVGGLIDADMSEESTKLQALQVKQSLGVQALSIANQSSQNILRLFQ